MHIIHTFSFPWKFLDLQVWRSFLLSLKQVPYQFYNGWAQHGKASAKYCLRQGFLRHSVQVTWVSSRSCAVHARQSVTKPFRCAVIQVRCRRLIQLLFVGPLLSRSCHSSTHKHGHKTPPGWVSDPVIPFLANINSLSFTAIFGYGWMLFVQNYCAV